MLETHTQKRKNSALWQVILPSLICFAGTVLLYSGDFATRGIWPTVARRLFGAILFGAVLMMGHLYAKRHKNDDETIN